MFEISRQMIAYAIIGAVFIVGTPLLVRGHRRRQREKLRRRGIKNYN